MITETTAGIIKVAIIEDRREIRESLAMLIGGTTGFECIGAYRSMEDALPRIGANLPDIVLSDIGLPGMDGIEGIKILRSCLNIRQFLFLSSKMTNIIA